MPHPLLERSVINTNCHFMLLSLQALLQRRLLLLLLRRLTALSLNVTGIAAACAAVVGPAAGAAPGSCIRPLGL